MKEVQAEPLLNLSGFVTDTETEMERKKKKRESEKEGQKLKGESRRIEWRKERRMKRMQDNTLLASTPAE
ncbi:hypothetical protein ILYODFUR_003256, partial [Ilyodon furcidens]